MDLKQQIGREDELCLGTAVSLSLMAERNLCVEEYEELEQYIPGEVFESNVKANVDGSYLVKFNGMTKKEEYLHRDMLIIE